MLEDYGVQRCNGFRWQRLLGTRSYATDASADHSSHSSLDVRAATIDAGVSADVAFVDSMVADTRSVIVDTSSGCIPRCSARVCGDDGCGGLCGVCQTGSCDIDGHCVLAATALLSRPGSGWQFGTSVDVSADGSYVAVGDPGGASHAGIVTVYFRSSGPSGSSSSWVARGTLLLTGSYHFGDSIAISRDGSIVVASELGTTVTRVAVFERSAGICVPR